MSDHQYSPKNCSILLKLLEIQSIKNDISGAGESWKTTIGKKAEVRWHGCTQRENKRAGHVILAKTSIMILIQVNKCLCPFPLLSHWIFINNFSFIYFECRLSLMICTEALLYCRESIEKRVSTLNCCGRKICRHYTSSPAWTEYWSAKSCHNVKSLNCRRFVSIMLYSSHAQNAGQ